jgi:hypothetical protein
MDGMIPKPTMGLMQEIPTRLQTDRQKLENRSISTKYVFSVMDSGLSNSISGFSEAEIRTWPWGERRHQWVDS